MFSLIAARLDTYALNLLRFCSKDRAEKPWLKTVGSELCGRECLGLEPPNGLLGVWASGQQWRDTWWVGLLSHDLEKGEKKEQRLLISFQRERLRYTAAGFGSTRG